MLDSLLHSVGLATNINPGPVVDAANTIEEIVSLSDDDENKFLGAKLQLVDRGSDLHTYCLHILFDGGTMISF